MDNSQTPWGSADFKAQTLKPGPGPRTNSTGRTPSVSTISSNGGSEAKAKTETQGVGREVRRSNSSVTLKQSHSLKNLRRNSI